MHRLLTYSALALAAAAFWLLVAAWSPTLAQQRSHTVTVSSITETTASASWTSAGGVNAYLCEGEITTTSIGAQGCATSTRLDYCGSCNSP